MSVFKVDSIPQVGAQLTDDLALPNSFRRETSAEACREPDLLRLPSLGIAEKPSADDLASVVNTLASVETVAFLSKLSSDDLCALRSLHTLKDRYVPDQLIDQLAEQLMLAQGKQALTINLIGPDNWQGVLKTPHLRSGKSFAQLLDTGKNAAHQNVIKLGLALAGLPDESFKIIIQLRGARPGIASFVDPISTLPDSTLKQSVGWNFDGWKVRKELEGSGHADARKNLTDIDPKNRLFAGMMGLSTFQMFRDLGREVCEGMIALGNKLIEAKVVSLPSLQVAMNSGEILSAIPFGNGKLIGLPAPTVAYLAEGHHDLWRINRALSLLLPPDLQQPAGRFEHRPFYENPSLIQNHSCLNILCLAVSLAEADKDPKRQGMVKGLLKSAAPDNALCLDMTVTQS